MKRIKRHLFVIVLAIILMGGASTAIIIITVKARQTEESPSSASRDTADTSEAESIIAPYTSIPPTFDGRLNEADENWGDPIATKTLTYNNSLTDENEKHEMKVYVMCDENNLYIAATVEGEDFWEDEHKDRDLLWIYFDENNNGIFEENEDIQRFPWDERRGDFHFTADGSWAQDEQSDEAGRWSYATGESGLSDYTYEFGIPLNSGDPQDLSIEPGAAIGIKVEFQETHYFEENKTWTVVGSDAWPDTGCAKLILADN